MSKREIWVKGEVAAREYLRNKGYTILEENYAGRMGEIDLIAEDGAVIVFVEVKARENTDFGYPIEAVTPQKVRKIVLTARQYLVQKRLLGKDVRFDVIEILRGEITHTENAFSLADAAKYCK